jgi:SAM-dependent methyltransferase
MNILLLGEGNCSFALEYAKQYQDRNLYVTNYDLEDTIVEKYRNKRILKQLRSMKNVQLYFGIDSTNCHFRDMDLIIFNFPHLDYAGSDTVQRHRDFFRNTFKSVQRCLTELGKFQISIFTAPRYRYWTLDLIAIEMGWYIESIELFEDYSEYKHVTTSLHGDDYALLPDKSTIKSDRITFTFVKYPTCYCVSKEIQEFLSLPTEPVVKCEICLVDIFRSDLTDHYNSKSHRHHKWEQIVKRICERKHDL